MYGYSLISAALSTDQVKHTQNTASALLTTGKHRLIFIAELESNLSE